jgi:hypothetical protein
MLVANCAGFLWWIRDAVAYSFVYSTNSFRYRSADRFSPPIEPAISDDSPSSSSILLIRRHFFASNQPECQCAWVWRRHACQHELAGLSPLTTTVSICSEMQARAAELTAFEGR